MTKSANHEYHENEAARLRALLEQATTPQMKALLLEQAAEHEQLARGEGQISNGEGDDAPSANSEQRRTD